MRLFLVMPQESGEVSHGLEFPGTRFVVSTCYIQVVNVVLGSLRNVVARFKRADVYI